MKNLHALRFSWMIISRGQWSQVTQLSFICIKINPKKPLGGGGGSPVLKYPPGPALSLTVWNVGSLPSNPLCLLGLSANAHFLFWDVGHCGERGQVSVYSWCHLNKKQTVHLLTSLPIFSLCDVTASTTINQELQEAFVCWATSTKVVVLWSCFI